MRTEIGLLLKLVVKFPVTAKEIESVWLLKIN